jgi:hypothetical protein
MFIFIDIFLQRTMCKLVYWLDSLKTKQALFIFLVFSISLISLPLSMSANEEHYFQLAYLRVSPTDFPLYHAVFDASNSRIFFETILGMLISFCGYDIAFVMARTINILLLATGLSFLFSSIGFSVLMSVGSIAIFYLFGQQFIGAEWIFGGVEAKTFAYAATFISLGYAFKQRWFFATLFAIIATYLHFLVGGFWAAVIIILAAASPKGIALGVRIFILYSIAILPIVTILVIDQFGADISNATTSITEIYVARNSHHISPFNSSFQISNWLPGISLLTCFGVFLFLIKGFENDYKIIKLSLLLIAYLFLALTLSFFDRTTNFFSKLYLFRPSSLILLLSLIGILNLYYEQTSKVSSKLLKYFVLSIIFYFSALQGKEIIISMFFDSSSSNNSQIIKAVQKYTNAEEIVLIDPKFSPNYSIHRQLSNPTLVEWKFLPAHPTDLIEWDKRMKFRNDLFTNGCTGLLNYPIRYLLVLSSDSNNSVKNCGKLLWTGNGNVYLIKVNQIFKSH